jgi:sigma-B regulation protein RsbU (phosphoserine phosphatase)
VVHIYTDGVTEAQDASDALYEESRLIHELGDIVDTRPEAIIGAVLKTVEEFVGTAPQFDDITMLTLRFDQPSSDADLVTEPQRRLMLTGFQGHESDFGGSQGGTPTPTTEAPPPPAVPASAPAVLKGVIRPPLPKPQRPRVEPDILAVTITNDVTELENLAEQVDAFVEKHGLPEKLAFNLNVCLDELITNIISYGYDDDGAHDIGVKFSYDGIEFVTEIEDDAREYDPFTEAPEPDLELEVDDRPIGGLGVFLVKEFMDATEYRHKAGRNWTTLRKTIGEQES